MEKHSENHISVLDAAVSRSHDETRFTPRAVTIALGSEPTTLRSPDS